MKLRLFEDRVIIKQTEAPKDQEGVLIPDASQVAPTEGVVIAVGPGVIRGENLQLRAIFNLLKWAIIMWWRHIVNKGDDVYPAPPDFTSDYNPMQVRVGDYVMFGNYAGTKITYQGEKYIMVRQSDVFMADDEKRVENPTV